MKCAICKKEASYFVQTIASGFGIGQNEYEARCKKHRLSLEENRKGMILYKSELKKRNTS